MSKLLDKLDKAAQPAPRRMGFVPADASAPEPPLVLIVRLDAASADSIPDALKHADAVILTVEQGSQASRPGNVPESAAWGVQNSGLAAADMAPLTEKGCDFFVLDAEQSRASLLNEENMTKVLRVSPAMEEAHLRVLEDVPIECVLIEQAAAEELRITDLMTLRSILTAVTKPSIVQVRPELSAGELAALRHVGVIGVVVDVGSKEDAEQLPRLHKEIGDLPPWEEEERRHVESLGSPGGSGHTHSLYDDPDG